MERMVTRTASNTLPRRKYGQELTREDAGSGAAAARGSQPRAETRPQNASTQPDITNAEIAKYQRALSNIDTISAVLDTPGGVSSLSPALLRGLLTDAKIAFTELIQRNEEPPSLLKVLQEVQAVHQTIKTFPITPAAPRQTWAQAVAATPPLTPPRSPSPCETSEITIRITDPQDRKAISDLPNETVVQKVQQACPEAKAVVAARKLPSGDVRLYVADEQVKTAMLREQTWAKCLGQSSVPTEQLYQVMIHGVRIDSISPSKPDDITKLQHDNKTLHPELRIVRAKWLRQTNASDKIYSTLVVGITDEQMANQVIRKGLVSNYALHVAEYYNSQFRVTQCFKCQAYGHIATNCRKADTCGHCALSHKTQDCTRKDDTKCANCNRRHAAWSGECSVRKAAKVRATQARLTAPPQHGPVRDRLEDSIARETQWNLVGPRNRQRLSVGGERKRQGPSRRPTITPQAGSQTPDGTLQDE